jgi:hypothetical protein
MEAKERTIHLLKDESCETCFVIHQLNFMLRKDIELALSQLKCKCIIDHLNSNGNDLTLKAPEAMICENYSKDRGIIVNYKIFNLP